jgi:probable rRNA maturation factor
LRRALKLGRRDFNICFVDDRAIAEFNAQYRGQARPTDVLSFPWDGAAAHPTGRPAGRRAKAKPGRAREFDHLLGDVVISVETARRNARREGHSMRQEIRWLILHGLLHLLGYDHATDQGEMTALEHELRARLGIADAPARRRPPTRHG